MSTNIPRRRPPPVQVPTEGFLIRGAGGTDHVSAAVASTPSRLDMDMDIPSGTMGSLRHVPRVSLSCDHPDDGFCGGRNAVVDDVDVVEDDVEVSLLKVHSFPPLLWRDPIGRSPVEGRASGGVGGRKRQRSPPSPTAPTIKRRDSSVSWETAAAPRLSFPPRPLSPSLFSSGLAAVTVTSGGRRVSPSTILHRNHRIVSPMMGVRPHSHGSVAGLPLPPAAAASAVATAAVSASSSSNRWAADGQGEQPGLTWRPKIAGVFPDAPLHGSANAWRGEGCHLQDNADNSMTTSEHQPPRRVRRCG